MKIASYQFAISGNIQYNFNSIKRLFIKQKKEVSLLVLPECCLTGYPPLSISSSDSVDFKLIDSLFNELQTISDETEISLVIDTIRK